VTELSLSPGTRFIDITKGFDDIQLLVVVKKPQQESTWIIINPARYNLTDAINVEAFTGKAFPDFSPIIPVPPGRWEQVKKIWTASLKNITQKIYQSPSKKIKVEDALDFYESIGLTKEEAVGAVKLATAKGFLEYRQISTGEFIHLSALIEQNEDKKRFLGSIGEEVLAKSKRIEFLVSMALQKAATGKHCCVASFKNTSPENTRPQPVLLTVANGSVILSYMTAIITAHTL